MRAGEPGLLPLSATDVERTRLPLEQARMLPGAAFTDPAVLAWEVENIFLRELGLRRPHRPGQRARPVPDGRAGRRERLRRRRRRRPPPRLPQQLPPPRRAARRRRPRGSSRACSAPTTRGPTGSTAACKNAPFTEGLEDFEPACFGLKPVRLAVVEGLVLLDLSGEAPAARRARRRARAAAGALPHRRAPARRRRSSTRSRPTGRRSPRTTTSACTAPACTRSSTASRTTSPATASPARAPGAAAR